MSERDALRRAILARLSPWAALRAELRALAGGDGSAAAWGVLIANGLLLAWAWHAGWGLADLLWPYWWQSLVIGGYTIARMLVLQRARTEGLTIPAGYDPQQVVRGAKWFFAALFALHYGMAHLVYAIFVAAMPGSGATGGWLGWIGLLALLLGGQHLAFREQRRRDAATPPNLVALMVLPYVRILPMHLIAVLGALLGGGAAALVVFGLLKTAADLVGLGYEQRFADALAEAAAHAPTVDRPN